jgi:hypothetical protein
VTEQELDLLQLSSDKTAELLYVLGSCFGQTWSRCMRIVQQVRCLSDSRRL